MSDHATQPDLFEPDAPQVKIRVTYHGTARYHAEIAGGWWGAWGYTKKIAIENVLKIYETEMSKNATN